MTAREISAIEIHRSPCSPQLCMHACVEKRNMSRGDKNHREREREREREKHQRQTFLVLDFGLHIVDGIAALHLERDGLARQGLHKYLHLDAPRNLANLRENKPSTSARAREAPPTLQNPNEETRPVEEGQQDQQRRP